MYIVASLINLIYYAFVILIFARFILSWVSLGSYELRETVFRLTEPVLEPVRRLLPPMGGLDFSPIIVLIAAQILRTIVIGALI
jgi:YggT family protein